MKNFKKITFMLLFLISLTSLFACNPVKFNINFMVEGNVYQTIETAGKETIVIPSDPQKSGYRFDGWFWDDETFKNPFTANSLLNQPIKADMNVYAKFTSYEDINRRFTVTYIVNGETYSTEQVQNWHKTTKPKNPSIKGYEFVGWYTNSSYTKEFDFNSEITCDTTIYAKMQEDPNACELISVTGFEKVDDFKFKTTVSNATTQFNFNGKITVSKSATTVLSKDSQGLQQSSNIVDLSLGDNTLYLTVLSPNLTQRNTYILVIHRNIKCKINIDNGYGTVTPVSIEEGNSYTFESISRTGYIFNGYKNETDTYQINDTLIVTKNDTFTASWIAKTTSITFDADGGSTVNEDTVSYDETKTFSIPTKRGYTFLGYKYNGEYITNKNGSLNSAWNIDEENVTLVAGWELIKYKINYGLSGLILDLKLPKTYTVKDVITLDTPPVSKIKNGWKFDGWYLVEEKQYITEIDGSKIIGEITIEDKISLITYTLTYNTNGGEILNDENVYVETRKDYFTIRTQTIYLEISVERFGYKFKGWTYKGETITDFMPEYNLMDMEVVAQWELLNYNIYYSYKVLNYRPNSFSYTPGPTRTNTLQTSYSVESDFTLNDPEFKEEYYRFVRFTLNENPITKINKETIPNKLENITIKIEVEFVEYSINYVLDGGKFDGENKSKFPSIYTYDSCLDLTSLENYNPTKENYVFKGWKDVNGNIITTISKTYGDITLTAIWEGKIITFYKNGVRSVSVTYNHNYEGSNDKVVTLTKNDSLQGYYPTRSGFIFLGWYSDAECETQAKLNQEIKKDTVVYAKWKAVTEDYESFESGKYLYDIRPNYEESKKHFYYFAPRFNAKIELLTQRSLNDTTNQTKIVYLTI